MPENSTLNQTDAETQTVETLISGVSGISAYQATVGGLSDPFAPPGTVPADPTQASVVVLVQHGQYDNAIAGVKQALSAYRGQAKLVGGQAQYSSHASSSQLQLHLPAADPTTL